MTNPAWEKTSEDEPVYEGVREASVEDFLQTDAAINDKIQAVLDAMDWPELIIFEYDGASRVVAPFVVGVSSEGNPLLRGYQVEGLSVSGKGAGWRVYQFAKMADVESHGEFFDADEFDFDRDYPWIYKVLRTL